MMLRSEINQVLVEAKGMIHDFKFQLPAFADWDVATFKAEHIAGRLGRVVEARMGWDITDYGLGDFATTGLTLFTLRNGTLQNLTAGRGMVYAEKLLISRKEQLSPMHRHIVKSEDIINRGGATLAVELFAADAEGNLDTSAGGTVFCDGMPVAFEAGEVLRFEPGQSVTLDPCHWHAFWGEGGDVLIGEVSTVNDDETDNIFRDSIGRFANVEEDEEPLHLLVSDYARLLT